jgi:hypothetical protein
MTTAQELCKEFQEVWGVQDEELMMGVRMFALALAVGAVASPKIAAEVVTEFTLIGAAIESQASDEEESEGGEDQ